MNVATQVLTPMLAIALVGAVLAIGRLVWGWVVAGNSAIVAPEDKDRIALEDRKEQVLTTLRDLEFEHATGKLSDHDYNDLKRFFEREALQVIADLDNLV